MKVWIITTGSSDVQLKTNEHWTILFNKVRGQLGGRTFTLSGDKSPITVPARVVGTVYGQPDASCYFEDLLFPLLDNFLTKISGEELDEIVLVLTDQHNVFSASERGNSSPFWQDTCMLLPILKKYLNITFPNSKVTPILLRPDLPTEGLDDWDYVFQKVQSEFSKLSFSEDSTIYVSHQAGTPAISSAVQFASLARFGTRVRFLVSSARDANLTRKLDSSSYLKGLQVQEAKALLQRFDYAGVMALIEPYLDFKTKILLEAAIQWNLADFNAFQGLLPETNKTTGFWWTGFESAYLACIRYKQKNIVEALFHSFRAAEGMICQWAESEYANHIFYDEKGSPQVKDSIQTILPEYWEKIEKSNSRWIQGLKDQNKPICVGLFSNTLYSLFQKARQGAKRNNFMKIIWGGAKDERNQQFHRLLGLQEEDLFMAWKATSEQEWQANLLGCLNFISKQNFQSLQETSLMAQVHRDLEREIASLAQTPD
jgi:hypothetical protein